MELTNEEIKLVLFMVDDELTNRTFDSSYKQELIALRQKIRGVKHE